MLPFVKSDESLLKMLVSKHRSVRQGKETLALACFYKLLCTIYGGKQLRENKDTTYINKKTQPKRVNVKEPTCRLTSFGGCDANFMFYYYQNRIQM